MGSVRHKFFICIDQTGTATSSPALTTASQSISIVNVMLWMKKNAFEESTVKKTAKILRHLQRNCNATNPEEVKLFIANKKCSNGRKQNLVIAYDKRMKSENLTWNKPFYQCYEKKRKAPRKELVEFLINLARLEMSLKLSISKDLGQRPVELTWLKNRRHRPHHWNNINHRSKTHDRNERKTQTKNPDLNCINNCQCSHRWLLRVSGFLTPP